MKKLITTAAFVCAIAVSALAQNKGEMSKTMSSISKEKVQTFSARPRPSGTQWGKHWNHGGIHCGGVGLYCIRRLVSEEAALRSLDKDETFGVPNVEIAGNNIKIITIGQGGTVSKETLELFKNRKIETQTSGLPPEIVEDLLMGLKAKSIEKVSFEPANQKYNVVSTTDNGKPVQIIEAYQKTRINIDGKTYNLLVITTSGKGSGSPKQAGF